MSSQDIHITVRTASDQVSTHDVHHTDRNHDAVSEMSGPPDYATLDPNELNRSVTPFPRPKSPTPSQMANWPLADEDDENRPDSSMSYTSSRPGRRAKSQRRKFRRNSPKNVNRPEPIAERRNRKRALSVDSTPGSPQKKTMLQVPIMAHLISRRSNKGLPEAKTSGSMSMTFTNNSFAADEQKKHGLISSLSRGDWTTVGSFFTQSINSASPRRGIGGREISQPFDFRHEGGIGSSSSAFLPQPCNTLTAIGQAEHENPKTEPTRTSTVLMDMRTESRLGNRTSLPVTMPNAFSPIDTTVFDADCGRNSAVRTSTHIAFNRFQSPPTPEEDLWHGQRSNSKVPHGHDPVSGDARIGTLASSTSKLLFAIMAILTQIFVVMSTASITVTVFSFQNDEKADSGAVVVLIVSLVGILISGIILAFLYAHRLSGRMVREYTGVRVETCLFQMSHERITYWSIVILTELAFLSTTAALTIIVVTAGKDEEIRGGVISWLIVSLITLVIFGLALSISFAHRVSNRIVRSHRAEQRDEEWVEMRSGTERNISHPGDQTKLARDIMRSATQGPLNDQESSIPGDHLTTEAGIHSSKPMTQIQNPRASLIGIARSDSLMRHPNLTPSMSSASTYESERTEKPIISKRFSSSAVHINSDPTTVLSAEEMSMISMPKQTDGIPHSHAMTDLSSEVPRVVTPSGTKSTITSLISSYASEPGAPVNNEIPVTRAYSPGSLGRRAEALHSHPVLRPIITEAGTPNSQKSIGRVESDNLQRDWSIRDGLATRMATMTPIEERSEDGTRSSLTTMGRRFSVAQTSECSAR